VILGAVMPSQPLDIPLRCRCSHVRGLARNVSPCGGLRFVCYCKDCQAFARCLDRADVLDAAGGSDIFQIPPARVGLTSGTDALRCLRLSATGVLRWYTACCATPIANTAPGPRFPAVALIHSFIHGPRSERPLPRRGARPTAVSHLRTFRRRAAANRRAATVVVADIRPPRIEDPRLVDARAGAANAIFPRSNGRSALHAARRYAGRAGIERAKAQSAVPTS
jgi:hypothetical protein